MKKNNTNNNANNKQQQSASNFGFVEVLKQLILFFQRLHVHKTEVSAVFAMHPINISK